MRPFPTPSAGVLALALFLGAGMPSPAANPSPDPPVLTAADTAPAADAAAPQKKKKEKVDQDGPKAQVEKASVALRYGLPDEAIRYARLAVEMDPKSSEAWNVMGLAHYQKREYPEAVAAFGKAVEAEPGFADAAYNLARAYQEMGEIDKAVEAYRRYEALKPDFRSAYGLAESLYRKNDLAGALDYAAKAVERNRESAPAHNLRGVILNQMGRPAEAVQSFLQGMRYAPDDPNIPVNLAIALINSHENAKAKAVLEQALPKAADAAARERIQKYLDFIKEQDK